MHDLTAKPVFEVVMQLPHFLHDFTVSTISPSKIFNTSSYSYHYIHYKSTYIVHYKYDEQFGYL